MLGAIIGDIVGSVYEFSNIKTKDFELFKPNCRFTDDTIMTCAVADAIMNGGSESDYIRSMKNMVVCILMQDMVDVFVYG